MIIHLCVNDPNNGNSTERLYAIQFDDVLKLESAFIPDPNVVCRLISHGPDMRIRIGRKTFPIKKYSYWVGNWCWDAVWVDDKTATEILAHIQGLKLHGRQKFKPEEDMTEIWDKYMSCEKITFPVKYMIEDGKIVVAK